MGAEPRPSPVPASLGAEMHELISELYPICRSITGDGFRETLRRIAPARAAEDARGADRNESIRLDRAEGVEHP